MASIGPEDMPIDPFDQDEVDSILNPEPDPATTAFLDQEEAAFAQERAMFKRIYGFDHDCRCSQDYTEGNTETVTKCFLTLTGQAMAYSAQATHELRYLTALLDRLVNLNNDLIGLMEDLGHEKELEEYFTRESEPEEGPDDDLDAMPDVTDVEEKDDDNGDGEPVPA